MQLIYFKHFTKISLFKKKINIECTAFWIVIQLATSFTRVTDLKFHHSCMFLYKATFLYTVQTYHAIHYFCINWSSVSLSNFIRLVLMLKCLYQHHV